MASVDGTRPKAFSSADVRRMVLLVFEEGWSVDDVCALYGVEASWFVHTPSFRKRYQASR